MLRQIPIWENGVASGFVDLALERAFVYRKQANAEVIEMPATVKERETEARFKMLEQLADYDDELMEQLLGDVQPPRDKVFADLVKELQDGLIVPVLLGSAENGNGILRLLKALRHEAPFVDRTARRLKLENAKSAAHVLKTMYTPHGGKLSVVRVLAGEFGEGTVVQGARSEERAAAAFSLLGPGCARSAAWPRPARRWRSAGWRRSISGETLSAEKGGSIQVKPPEPPQPVYGVAIGVKDRKDEVKLTGALARLMEEDPSLRLQHAKETHQMVLWGQGEMHLRVALERLKRKYGVDAESHRRVSCPTRRPSSKGVESARAAQEAVGRPRAVRRRGARHQAAAARLGLPVRRDDHRRRGAEGSSSPRSRSACMDYLQQGPLGGFPVVDVSVTLTDGSYHSVDSSDMAFRQAGRIGMSEGMPKCNPVLLEPVMEVEIAIPYDATARINGMIPQRRGQILGFDARDGLARLGRGAGADARV